MQILNRYNNGSPTIMDKSTTIASYTASISTAAGGLMSLNNIALMLGIIFAAGTFFVNWYSQHHKIKLDKQKRVEDAEFHEARMADLLKEDAIHQKERVDNMLEADAAYRKTRVDEIFHSGKDV